MRCENFDVPKESLCAVTARRVGVDNLRPQRSGKIHSSSEDPVRLRYPQIDV